MIEFEIEVCLGDRPNIYGMMLRETTKIQFSLAVPIFQLSSSYHFKRVHGDFLSHKQSPFRMLNYLISKVHGAFLLLI